MESGKTVTRREFLDTTGKAAAATSCCILCHTLSAAPPELEQKPELKLVAPCGVYCGACDALVKSVHAEGPESKHCHGCLSNRVPTWSREKCTIRPCAMEKRVESCAVCKGYPCEKLKSFQKQKWTKQAGENLEEVAGKGLEVWKKEQKVKWSCKKCKAPYSRKDVKCHQCGELVGRSS